MEVVRLFKLLHKVNKLSMKTKRQERPLTLFQRFAIQNGGDMNNILTELSKLY